MIRRILRTTAVLLPTVLITVSPGRSIAGALLAAGPQPLNVAASGADGAGTINTYGRSCVEGGTGSYWHYDYSSPVAGGVFSSLPSFLRLHLNLHSQGTGTPQQTYSNAFLLGGESQVALWNERGTIRLTMRSQGDGTCASPTMAFDGVTSSGSGAWTVSSADGAYRATSGSGTFNLGRADVAPGANNPFQLGLNGAVSVLPTNLSVAVVRTFWGNLGLDYATRRVSVTYQITNTGPGDSFGARFRSSSSPTNGVTPLGPTPQPLGDLMAGQSATVTVRYQLGLLSPCSLVILSCNFTTSLSVSLPDPLDVDNTSSFSNAVKAPDLPPPL
jgi:hypothetical protein